jgi:putative transposase
LSSARDIRKRRKGRRLTDNGSILAAGRTLKIAADLNLEPCVALIESHESHGVAEALVNPTMCA